MARPADPDPSERFQMVVKTSKMERVDEWRRAQQDIPNRSEAVRRMMDIVLAMGIKQHEIPPD